MSEVPRLSVRRVELFERPVRLRMPFRFGVVTLREAPQAFVRAEIELEDGRCGHGQAAELLVPKWFDKSPSLTNEDNFNQLRTSLALAVALYEDEGGSDTAFRLHAARQEQHREVCDERGLPGLVAGFGTALVDRAVLDGLCRMLGVSVFEAVRRNLPGIDSSTTPDLAGFALDGFLAGLAPSETINARHTVGLVDPIRTADIEPGDWLHDGLPQSLEEVVSRYGHHYFKLKVSGNLSADVARLIAIAAVLDAIEEPYRVTLDGNEQFSDEAGVLALLGALEREPRLARLSDSLLYIEQPIARATALDRRIDGLAQRVPVAIDESDESDAVFPRAKELGYTGVSCKSCKGLYRAVLNAARVAHWNAQEGGSRYFMTAEDLTTQAGVSVQQDLAIAALIGCTHIERNGHHYVDGMAGAPADEQRRFLSTHADLYREGHGRVRLRIAQGRIALGSLDVPGLGCGPEPDWQAMTPMMLPA